MRIFLVLFLCVTFVQDLSAQWKKIDVGTLAWLRSVYFLNETRGWIVGSNGTFLTTSDGGESWKAVRGVSRDDIRDVFFIDEHNGWLLCERDKFTSGGEQASFVLATSDGGQSWENIDLGTPKEKASRMYFSKAGRGMLLGESGTVWESETGKSIWNKSVLPTRYLILGAVFTDDRTGFLVGGGGTILSTEDGGKSWKQAVIGNDLRPKLKAITFVSHRIGWTVGNIGTIFKTTNGGRFWVVQDSGVKSDLNDVFFISENEGFAVGSEGTVLRTTDGGERWVKEDSGTKARLEQVVITHDYGFAIGFGGVLLRQRRIR